MPHTGYPGRHGTRIAPACAGVLQVRYMRKWMSERLKRRKKPGDGSAKEATKAPEPLQPRFYDDEPAAPAEVADQVPVKAPVKVPVPAPVRAPVEAPVVESRRASRPQPVSVPEPASETDAVSGAVEPKPRVSRRRRGRGGRGRSRPGRLAAAPASAATESVAAEASAPEPVVAAKLPTEAAPVHAAPVQAAPAPARASKGTVVLAIGLPGSGKSSWFKRHNIHPLSSDLLRELLFDDAQEQRFQDLVFSNLRSMLKARLIARRPMNYVDATNLTPHDRHSWIKLAKDYGYDVQ